MRLFFLIIAVFLVWLATCAFCVFLLDWPRMEVLRSAGVSAIMIVVSTFIQPYIHR